MNTLTRPASPANPLSSPLFLPPRFLEPENLRWGRFPTADGAELRWAHAEAASPTMNCVLVGGFSEFIEKYFETTRNLNARGISVWCLDWRGQGGSTRDPRMPTRPLARAFDRDAADLTAFVKFALPSNAWPRILIAHSMGAAIALLSLHAEPTLVDAAILSAPMLAVRTGFIPAFAARAIAYAATASGFGGSFIPGAGPWIFDSKIDGTTSLTSHDPNRCLVQRHWFTHHSHLRIDGLTYGWLNAAFALTRRLQRADLLEAITTPLLIGSAGKEFFVDPAAHRKAAARLPHAKFAVFPDAKHELFLEADAVRDRWLADIDIFLAGFRGGHP